jgi:acid phosphatase family membrane protein YuiD
MTTTRIVWTTKALALALAVSAFAAPAADAKPLETPAGAPPSHVHHASALAHGSTVGIGWAEAAIAVATIVVLIGLVALGARTANRSTVEA